VAVVPERHREAISMMAMPTGAAEAIGEAYPYSVYDFNESRARDGPAKFLAGFQGYLHADAYGGYDYIYLGSNDSVREVACWAHARRKFFEAMRGVPQHVRSDNGPEFIALAIQKWLGQVGVQTLYIAPGAPWENGYAESFHSRLRDEFLAVEEFENVAAARKLTTAWQDDYNHHRPHSSLG
jgi:hypothetical protein